MNPKQISPTQLCGARIHNGRRRHDAPTPMLPCLLWACYCCHRTKMQCAIVIALLSLQQISTCHCKPCIFRLEVMPFIYIIYIHLYSSIIVTMSSSVYMHLMLMLGWLKFGWSILYREFVMLQHQAQMRRFRMSWAQKQNVVTQPLFNGG